MSRRKTILASLKVPCEPGEAPNAYVGSITVEVRLAFPPHIPTKDVEAVLDEVYQSSLRQLWNG